MKLAAKQRLKDTLNGVPRTDVAVMVVTDDEDEQVCINQFFL